MTTDAKLPQRLLILCVQLDEKSFELIKRYQSAAVEVRLVSYLDTRLLADCALSASLLLCGWDGVGKKAQAFIAGFLRDKERLADARIFPVITAFTPKDALPRDKLKVERWFKIPEDMARIDSLVYTLTESVAGHAKEEADVVAEKTAALQLPAAKHLSEAEVWAKVVAASKPDTAREPAKQQAAPAAGTGISKKQPLLVFSEVPTVCETLMRRLREAGYHNTRRVDKISDTLIDLRENPCDLLVMWYQDDSGSVLKVLSELHEARDLPFVGTLVLCPGEAAVKAFATEARHFFVDAVAVQPSTQTAFSELINSAMATIAKPSLLRRNLYDLRKPWRPGTPGFDRSPWTPDALAQAKLILATVAGKDIWAKVDLVLHQLLAGEIDDAERQGAALLAEHPHNIDAEVAFAAVRAKKGEAKAIAKALVETIETLHALTEDRCYRLGRMFVRWNAMEALGTLLSAWSTREELTPNAQFSFLAALWFRKQGDRNREKAYLLEALAAAPRRADYIAEYAEYLEKSGLFDKAAGVWRLAAVAFLADAARCQLGLARCLAETGDYDQARAIANEVTARDPKNSQAQELLKRFSLRKAG
jgi:tetratricopeptide (TPR) repeat protein